MSWKPCKTLEHMLDTKYRCKLCGTYVFPKSSVRYAITKESEKYPVTRNLLDDPEVPLGYRPISSGRK